MNISGRQVLKKIFCNIMQMSTPPFTGGRRRGQGDKLAGVGGGRVNPEPESRAMEAHSPHRTLPRQQSPDEAPP